MNIISKKLKKFSIIFIIILVIVGISYYFIQKNTKDSSAKKEFTIVEINTLLSYVPMANETYESTEIKDAYSISIANTANITTDIYLQQAFLAASKSDSTEEVKAEFCGESTSCLGDIYVKIDEFNKQLKKMYNISSSKVEKFNILGGTIYKTEKYYVAYYSKGAYLINKVSKILSYKIENNNLIILEKAGFYSANGAIYNLYKEPNGTLIKTFDHSLEDITAYGSPDLEASNYIKENLDKFNTYKHTFKVNSNGDYYWYSTEVE